MSLKLTKKPVDVEGVKYTGDNLDEVKAFCPDCYTKGDTLFIQTMEGDHEVVDNAIVVKGVKGEFYPVDPSVIEETYEIHGETDEVSTEKRWNKEQKEEAPDYKWALPEKNKLRIDDAKHIRLAWSMVDKTNDLTDEDRKKARKRILAKAGKFGIDTSNWKTSTENHEEVPSSFFNHVLIDVIIRSNILSMYASLAIRHGIYGTNEDGDYYFSLINKRLDDVMAAVNIIHEEINTVTPAIDIKEKVAVEAYLEKLKEDFHQGLFTYPVESE